MILRLLGLGARSERKIVRREGSTALMWEVRVWTVRWWGWVESGDFVASPR